jgi:hypothetical protein
VRLDAPTTPRPEEETVRYEDRVVIVTGGTKGIGLGCSRVFAEAGSRVVICARGEEAGKALAAELSERGPGSAVFQRCDVSKVEEVERLIDDTPEAVTSPRLSDRVAGSDSRRRPRLDTRLRPPRFCSRMPPYTRSCFAIWQQHSPSCKKPPAPKRRRLKRLLKG